MYIGGAHQGVSARLGVYANEFVALNPRVCRSACERGVGAHENSVFRQRPLWTHFVVAHARLRRLTVASVRRDAGTGIDQRSVVVRYRLSLLLPDETSAFVERHCRWSPFIRSFHRCLNPRGEPETCTPQAVTSPTREWPWLYRSAKASISRSVRFSRLPAYQFPAALYSTFRLVFRYCTCTRRFSTPEATCPPMNFNRTPDNEQ